MKIFTFILAILLIVGGALYFLFILDKENTVVVNEVQPDEIILEDLEDEPEEVEEPVVDETQTALGTSVNGNTITAYHFGAGEKELLFIGGIHGAYSWNTVLLSYQLMDYLEQNESNIPGGLKVTVIPALNPDGLEAVLGTTERFSPAVVPADRAETVPGRFNGRNVDLNRNFDCDWESTGVWQDTTVNGGSAPFSEPESAALRQYIEANSPEAVVVYYSAVGGVFASNCHSGILPETQTLTNLYADASGYPAYEEFDFYEITGDAVNWMAKNNVPAISVLLSTHDDTEWEKNRKGIEEMISYYGAQQ